MLQEKVAIQQQSAFHSTHNLGTLVQFSALLLVATLPLDSFFYLRTCLKDLENRLYFTIRVCITFRGCAGIHFKKMLPLAGFDCRLIPGNYSIFKIQNKFKPSR